MTTLATITDSSGRRVRLTEERWRHVIDGHPELEPFLLAVLAAVEAPSRWLAGRAPGEEWYLAEGSGPSRWLQVVVAFSGDDGNIVTAFGRRRLP